MTLKLNPYHCTNKTRRASPTAKREDGFLTGAFFNPFWY
jgi:hypothetical protein